MYKIALSLFAPLLFVACVSTTNDSKYPKEAKEETELKFLQSVLGSPIPQDITEPHMPGVDVLSDMNALFAKARAFTVPTNSDNIKREGERHLVIVTPGRNLLKGPMLNPDLGKR